MRLCARASAEQSAMPMPSNPSRLLRRFAPERPRKRQRKTRPIGGGGFGERQFKVRLRRNRGRRTKRQGGLVRPPAKFGHQKKYSARRIIGCSDKPVSIFRNLRADKISRALFVFAPAPRFLRPRAHSGLFFYRIFWVRPLPAAFNFASAPLCRLASFH